MVSGLQHVVVCRAFVDIATMSRYVWNDQRVSDVCVCEWITRNNCVVYTQKDIIHRAFNTRVKLQPCTFAQYCFASADFSCYGFCPQHIDQICDDWNTRNSTGIWSDRTLSCRIISTQIYLSYRFQWHTNAPMLSRGYELLRSSMWCVLDARYRRFPTISFAKWQLVPVHQSRHSLEQE